jgi:hypothetical protein
MERIKGKSRGPSPPEQKGKRFSTNAEVEVKSVLVVHSSGDSRSVSHAVEKLYEGWLRYSYEIRSWLLQGMRDAIVSGSCLV